MSEEGLVEVKLPKNVIAALKEYVLEGETVEEYIEREIPPWVAADIDCIAGELHEDPIPIIERYGLGKYYFDC